MGLTIGHIKNVTVADGTDSNVVRPSDWNSAHAVTMSLAGGEVIKYIQAGTNSVSSGTVSFANSNGISFGMATNGIITGTVATNYQSAGAYLTTAMVSNAGSNFAGLNFSGNNVTGTLNSSGLTLSVAAPGGGGGAAISAGTNSISTGTVHFNDANGVTFQMSPTGDVSASVATNYQSQGAYLTTARASNDAIGLNTALTANGVSVTANSSGLSLNFPAFLTTAAQSNHSHAFATTTTGGASVVVGTSNSNGITVGVPAYLTTYAAQTTQPVAYAAGGTTNNFSTLAFGNSNGLSWSTGTQGVFPSVAVLTTAMASNAGSNFAGLSTGATNASVTLNSQGIAISVAPGGGGGDGYNIIAVAGTTAPLSATVGFTNSNGVSFGMVTTGGSTYVSASVATNYQSQGAYLTTAMASNAGSNFMGLNSALTANGVSMTANSSGLSLNFPAFLTTAANSTHTHGSAPSITGSISVTSNSGAWSISIPAFITTAMVSNAGSNFLGLNSALTANGVSATMNSSGVSLNFPAFLTTASPVSHSHGNPTLALTNLTGTTASASNGFTLSLSAAAAGGGAFAAGASTDASGTTGTVGNQIVFFEGANITLSQSINGGSASLSIIGPTPGGGGAGTIGGWQPYPALNNTTFSSLGQNSLYMQKVMPLENISFNNLEFKISGSFVSTSVSNAVFHTMQYGIYSLNTANDSYGLLASSSMAINASNSSNASYAMTISQGTNSFSNSSLGTVNASLMSGMKHLYLPYTGTLTAGVNYAVALLISSTSSAGGAPLRIAFWEQSIINNISLGKLYASTALGSNASYIGDYGQGVYGTTTGVMPSSVAKSQLTNAISQMILYHQFEV